MSRLKWILLAVLCAALAFASLTRWTHTALALTAPAQKPALFVVQNGPLDDTSTPPLVSLRFSVINATGAHISSLGKSQVAVTEDGNPVAELTIAEEQVGLAVVLVVDRGGMSQPGVHQRTRLGDALSLGLSLTQRVRSQDLLGLVALDANGLAAPTATLTTDAATISATIATLTPVARGGITNLYDGLCSALDALSTAAPADLQTELTHRRKALVVFADSLDQSSTRCTATDVRDRARAQDVLIYTIGFDTPEALRPRTYLPLDPVQLQWIAASTRGHYLLHGDASGYTDTLKFFDQLLTQRRQYRLTFRTRLPQGPHKLTIAADTNAGAGSFETVFTSSLQLPQIKLLAPTGGTIYTRSRVLTATLPISLALALAYPDGLTRTPSLIEYSINDVVVLSRTAEPYSGAWDASGLATGTYRIAARVYDPALNGEPSVESDPAFIEIGLEAPRPPDQRTLALAWVQANWFSIFCVPALGLLAIVAVLRFRHVLAGLRKGSASLAENMPGMFGPTRGRLVVTKGATTGREYRLIKPLSVIGREQALCDIAVEDRFVSARHAVLRLGEDGNFALTDEGSQNGTFVNGMRIPARQAIMLPFDSVIRLGDTELVLRREGSALK